MKSLPLSDAVHFQAAQGWRELGSPAEAARELDKIAPQYRQHPDILEERGRAYAATHQWYPCLSVADALTDLYPSRASGWLLLAQAQHGLHRTADACETLLAVLDRFPENPEIAYQLAKYGCQLGWMREARKWLEQALTMDDSRRLAGQFASDPVLASLHPTEGKQLPSESLRCLNRRVT